MKKKALICLKCWIEPVSMAPIPRNASAASKKTRFFFREDAKNPKVILPPLKALH